MAPEGFAELTAAAGGGRTSRSIRPGRNRSQDVAGGHQQPVLTTGRNQHLDLPGAGGVVGDQQHRLPGVGRVSQLRLVPPGLLLGRRQVRIRHLQLPQ